MGLSKPKESGEVAKVEFKNNILKRLKSRYVARVSNIELSVHYLTLIVICMCQKPLCL